jgi:hypothetical protein
MRAAAAVLIVITTATPIDSARWWLSARWRSRLGLTAAQTQAIETIYDTSRAERIALLTRAQGARARVDILLASEAPDSIVEEAMLAADDAESAYRHARTLMLLRIIRLLSSEQRRELARAAAPPAGQGFERLRGRADSVW